MKDRQHIDELLNAYIDGELAPRQQTEVERLVGNDVEIAYSLTQLKKMQSLMQAVPLSEPPVHLLEDIKLAIERRQLLGPDIAPVSHSAGLKHLIFRKALSAAAVIALLGILGAVVYNVLAPTKQSARPTANSIFDIKKPVFESQTPQIAAETVVADSSVADGAEKGESNVSAAAQPPVNIDKFQAKLVLNVDQPDVMASYVSKAVALTIPIRGLSAGSTGNPMSKSLVSSPDSVAALAEELNYIWPRLDKAVLYVTVPESGENIVINNVTAAQLSQIVSRESLEGRIALSKSFAAFNNINISLPGRTVISSLESADPLAMIPKPALTSPTVPKDDMSSTDEPVYLEISISTAK